MGAIIVTALINSNFFTDFPGKESMMAIVFSFRVFTEFLI
jgi:hypothetical protein